MRALLLVSILGCVGLNGQSLLIRGGRIVDPETAKVGPPTDLFIVDGRIKAIGPQPPAAVRGVRVLQAKGKYLIPGLIDTHVHVGHLDLLPEDVAETRPELVKAYQDYLPQAYLRFGFTTLVDPDLKPSMAAAWRKHPVAPDLFGCGRGIRLLDGYGQAFLPEALRRRAFPTWVFNPGQDLPPGTDPGEHSPGAAVLAAVQAGAIAIKTYHESGFGGLFHWPTPTPQVLDGVVLEAHRAGLPVLLHATGLDGYQAGVRAGVDMFAHGLWHWPGASLTDTELTEEVKTVLQEVAKARIKVQPTLRVTQGEWDLLHGTTLNHPRLKEALPPSLRNWLLEEGGADQARKTYLTKATQLLSGKGITVESGLAAVLQRGRNVMKAYQALGVPLIFGTDTPSVEGPGNIPGLNGRQELQAWVEAGVPLPAILSALTIGNARAFNLDKDRGTLEVGKRADLLVLGQNPLRTAEAFDRMDWVILQGRVVAFEPSHPSLSAQGRFLPAPLMAGLGPW